MPSCGRDPLVTCVTYSNACLVRRRRARNRFGELATVQLGKVSKHIALLVTGKVVYWNTGRIFT